MRGGGREGGMERGWQRDMCNTILDHLQHAMTMDG